MYLVEPIGNISIRKHFVDGQKQKPIWPKTWRLVDATPNPSLEDIYEILKYVQDNRKNYAILPNKPIRFLDEERKIFSRAKNYEDRERGWFQLDIDWEVSNELGRSPLADRVAFARERLPFLTKQDGSPVGMVAQLSSSAGIQLEQDARKFYKLGLRLYIQLAKPLNQEGLFGAFGGWLGRGEPPFIDHNMCYAYMVHMVAPPKLIRTPRRCGTTSLILIKGDALDVSAIGEAPEKREREQQEAEVTNIAFAEYDSKDIEEELLQLGKEGVFVGESNTALFKLINGAVWSRQNAQPIVQIINKHKEINRGRSPSDMEGKQKKAWGYAKDYFLENLWNQDDKYKFTHIYEDLNVKDMNDADLSVFINRLMKREDKLTLVCKSPHGSAKTTVLIPIIVDALKKRLGRDPRILYICSLRSVIRQTTNKLGYACYLTEGNSVSVQVVEEADKLGICLKSLRLTRGNEIYDLVVSDESEQLGLWAQGFSNTNHNALIDTHRAATVNVFMDADAGDMTYAMARKVSEGKSDLELLYNTNSWIRDQTAFLYEREVDWYLKLEEGVAQGKRIFVNVDWDDKDVNPRISMMVNRLNDLMGKEVAIGFDSKNLKAPLEFFNSPDAYIQKQFDRGIQVVITSPVVSVGWRTLVQPRFDWVMGRYSLGIQTAPQIIQQSQRTPVLEQHLYISRDYKRIHIERLIEAYRAAQDESVKALQAYVNELTGEDIATNLDLRKRITYRDEAQEELQIQATALLAKHRSAIRLHFYLLWMEFGGQIVEVASAFDFDNEEDALEVKKVLGNYQRAKELEMEQRSRAILNDPYALQKLERVFLKGTSNGWSNASFNTDEVNDKNILSLLKQQEKALLHKDQCNELFRLLTADNDTLEMWDLLEPEWKAETIFERGKTDYHYRIVAKLFRSIFADILEEEVTPANLKLFIENPDRKVAVFTEDLKKSDFHELKRKYDHIFRERIPTYISGMTEFSLIRKVLGEVLGYQVSSKQSIEGVRKLPEVKNDLIKEYMRVGILRNSKNPKVNQAMKFVQREISKKLLNDDELSDLEEEYLAASQFVLIAKPKKYIHKSIIRAADEVFGDTQCIGSSGDKPETVKDVIADRLGIWKNPEERITF